MIDANAQVVHELAGVCSNYQAQPADENSEAFTEALRVGGMMLPPTFVHLSAPYDQPT